MRMFLVSATLLGLAACATLAGCAGEARPQTTTASEAPPPETAAHRIDTALVALDTGGDVATAAEALEGALVLALDEGDRARALLGLSRARELAGRHDDAIALAEQAVQGHADGAEAHLHRLLTGKDKPASFLERDVPIAPFARALEPFFPVGPAGEVTVRVRIFGPNRSLERLGTFAVGDAIRDHAEARCPGCPSVRVKTGTTIDTTSWPALPAHEGEAATSLMVVTTSLESLVPSRYDRFLAVPSATLAEHLHAGRGVIAVRKREGAPPLITLAAPREGQLPLLEERLAALSRIPAEPIVTPLPVDLTHPEIQAVVRGSMGGLFRCYQDLGARVPKAEGNLQVHFAIDGAGHVSTMRLTTDPGLDEPQFRACFEGAWRRLAFPATGVGKTTVVYPLLLTSGD